MQDTPAFPLTYEHHQTNQTRYHHGMTLRDYFAGQALAGFMSSTDVISEFARANLDDPKIEAATVAYQYADAMMKARENEGNKV